MRVLLLCALIWAQFGAVSAWGETFQVDAMKVLPDVAWERGEAEREENESLYLLRWPGEEKMEVAISRRATVLKNDAESFLYHLGKIWQAQYGRRAEIDQVTINGRQWLACRRPAADENTRVFQFATVHEGRAYSLVAFVPQASKGLPKPVFELVKSAEFQATRWRRERIVSLQPEREALAALAELDAEHLGKTGLLTGFGVDARDDGVDWFVEGYVWRGWSKERKTLESRGRLQAAAPENADAGLTLKLELAAGELAGVAAEARVYDLCAAPATLDDALARLARGARAPLEKLQRERPAACPRTSKAAPQILLAEAGQTRTADFEFTLPQAWPALKGMQRAQLISLKLRPESGVEFGENLTQALGWFVVYRPE